jgi:hypothetical protein
MAVPGIGAVAAVTSRADILPPDWEALERVWPTLSLGEQIAMVPRLFKERESLFPKVAELILGMELSRVSLDRPLAALIARIDDDAARKQTIAENRIHLDAVYERRDVAFDDLDEVGDLLVAGYRYEWLASRGEEQLFERSFDGLDVVIGDESRDQICQMLIGATLSLSKDHPTSVRFIIDLAKHHDDPKWYGLFCSMLRHIAEYPRLNTDQRLLVFDGLFRASDPEFHEPFVRAYWEGLIGNAKFEELLQDPREGIGFDEGLVGRLLEHEIGSPSPEVVGWMGYTLVVLGLDSERRADYLKSEQAHALVLNADQTRFLVDQHREDKATLRLLQKRLHDRECRAIVGEAIGGLIARANGRRSSSTLVLPSRTMGNFAAALASRGAAANSA